MASTYLRTEIEKIPLSSAFLRFAASSVSRTTTGILGAGWPRIVGRVRDKWDVYQAVAFRMPWIDLVCSGRECRYMRTSIISVVRCFVFFANYGRLPTGLNGSRTFG